MKKQSTHDYDNNNRIFFLLLQEILGSNYDFSFVDDVLEFQDSSYNDTYSSTYISRFQSAILCGNFNKAYTYLDLYAKDLVKRGLSIPVITKLQFHLLGEIHKKRQERKKENIQKQFIKYCENIKELLEQGHFQEAYNSLEVNCSLFANISEFQDFKVLLSLVMSENSKTSNDIVICYDDIKENYNLVFNRAISSFDYNTAYRTIGKCIYYDPNNIKLQIYHILLRSLYKKNQKLDEQDVSKINPVVSISLISKLIYEKNYGEAIKVIDAYRNYDNNQMLGILYRLLQAYFGFVDGTLIFEEKNCDYQYSRTPEIFKRFFEALRYQDYNEAYQCACICQELVRNRNTNDNSFDLYIIVLTSILEVKEENKEKAEYLKKEKELDLLLSNFIEQFSRLESYDDFENLLVLKYEMCHDDVEKSYLSYALDMISMLKFMDENPISEDDFNIESKDFNSSLENFFTSLKVGDYVSASHIIFGTDFMKKSKNLPHQKYFVLFRKLLARFQNKLVLKKKYEPSFDVNQEEVTTQRILLRFIKKRKFEEAFAFYQAHQEEFSQALQNDLNEFFRTIWSVSITQLDTSFEFDLPRLLK